MTAHQLQYIEIALKIQECSDSCESFDEFSTQTIGLAEEFFELLARPGAAGEIAMVNIAIEAMRGATMRASDAVDELKRGTN